MPKVTVNDVELHYERAGSGPPLLLIMGMSGTTAHWGAPFRDLLEAEFDVIAYDHRGAGQSQAWMEPFTIPELADDALALLDALEVAQTHVCGISMGGMVAQELALLAPDRVISLTLGCTYPGGADGALTTPDDMRELAEALGSGDRGRALKTLYAMNVSAAYADAPGNFDTFLERASQNPASQAFIGLQAQAIGGHDASGRLAEITAPTLVIHGTEDRMLPVSNAPVIAGLIPNARLEIMDGIGHLFFWELPEESAALVCEHAAAAAALN